MVVAASEEGGCEAMASTYLLAGITAEFLQFCTVRPAMVASSCTYATIIGNRSCSHSRGLHWSVSVKTTTSDGVIGVVEVLACMDGYKRHSHSPSHCAGRGFPFTLRSSGGWS